jgi:hypothetical protein
MKIAYFSRNKTFAEPLLEELRQHHVVKSWKYNPADLVNTISIKNLLDWCDLGFLEWLQPPTIEISQLQGVNKPLIAFCQGLGVLNHTFIDWRNIKGLIIQDANYDRLMVLRQEWEKKNPDKPPLPKLPKMLIQSLGVDLKSFNWQPMIPGFHIAIHATNIRDVKRIYVAIQQFYDLIQRDPDKPWKLTLIGHWESGWKDLERMEYLQAIRELITILNFPPNRFFMIPRNLPKDKWIHFTKTVDIYWCTSWRESYGKSKQECVASGAFPLVNYYMGAQTIYPKKYLCKTPGEMVDKTIEWGNLSEEEKTKQRARNRRLVEPKFDERKCVKAMRLFIEEIAQ